MSQVERYCLTCGASNQPEVEKCFACGASLNSAAHAQEPATDLHILRQRYRLLSQVGSGGFSAVYKAEDTQTRKLVAIKALSLRGLSAQEKIEATDAFNREVGLLSKLQHRSLPRIYDHFSDPECWYLVMDFISGSTLEKRLGDMGKALLPVEEVLDIGLVLCDVLDYLHSQQPPIIFRDLKPANIMLTTDGRLFLIDFGIARQFKPGQAKDTIPFGSPGYAAPEQYGKAQTTPRADIYSLGVILHQLLSGDDPSHSPFSFAPLKQQGASIQALNNLILRMVALEVNKRPESCNVVRQELRSIAAQQTRFRGVYSQQTFTATQSPWPQTIYQPSTPIWPSPPGPTPTQSSYGYATSTAMAGQLMVGQTYAGQTYTAPPLSAPVQAIRSYAISSLVLSLVGIFLPPFLCFFGTALDSYNFPRFSAYAWFIIPLVLIPSLLAIIFGHIARNRARKTPGAQASADTAITGLTIGYIFGGIYLVALLCIMATATAPFMPPH